MRDWSRRVTEKLWIMYDHSPKVVQEIVAIFALSRHLKTIRSAETETEASNRRKVSGSGKSNCIIFTFLLYRRRKRKGKEGYILRRKSRLGTVLIGHWLYGERRKNGLIRLINYVPLEKEERKYPPAFFNGYVKFGDNQE